MWVSTYYISICTYVVHSCLKHKWTIKCVHTISSFQAWSLKFQRYLLKILYLTNFKFWCNSNVNVTFRVPLLCLLPPQMEPWKHAFRSSHNVINSTIVIKSPRPGCISSSVSSSLQLGLLLYQHEVFWLSSNSSLLYIDTYFSYHMYFNVGFPQPSVDLHQSLF